MCEKADGEEGSYEDAKEAALHQDEETWTHVKGRVQRAVTVSICH